MSIIEKAKIFAIKSHKGQVRKSEKDKPMIIHPINVAQILNEYNYDANVVAAGYLHDVVEDTKYTLKDIEDNFGEDIKSLVDTASEPDKSLTWEERKQHTIDTIKTKDLRHKAIVCADKISNLEDLQILFEKQGKYNFDNFKRDFDSQKWYYQNLYNSLVYNEDENSPIFIRLKELINNIFEKKDMNFIKDEIFYKKDNEYKELLKINYKLKEIKKLKNILKHRFTYVIEFTGTPRTGKTTLINNLEDFFKKEGFDVSILEEFTTSKKYKEEIKPLLQDKYKKVVNFEIPKYVSEQLKDELEKDLDIIIVDRSLVDRMIWVDRLYLKKGLEDKEYISYLNTYIPKIKENINYTVATYTDGLTALKRDYNAYLTLAKRSFLNMENIEEYNKSLFNIEKIAKGANIKFKIFDTTKKSERKISFEVADSILNDMRKEYINKIKEELNNI